MRIGDMILGLFKKEKVKKQVPQIKFKTLAITS